MKRGQDGAPSQGPKLLNRRDIDVQDDLESAWKACWTELQSKIGNSSEADAVGFLQVRVGEGQERHNEVIMALLFSVFTVPQVSLLHWKWLNMCQRDDWDFCVGQLKRIALEKFHKLMEPCKKQLMWILQELIRARVKNLDGVFSGLLRHVAGGDYTPKNTQLAASLLKMLQDNKPWLYASPRLISVVFYTFTRLITDHSKQPALTTLRQHEITFTSTLFREKFEECRVIGRDLIRLIDEVRKFPEFEVIWKDLLHKPASFSPTLTNITDLLSVRTAPKYFGSRLTPDMEAQLMFILKNVKLGNQKRYQTWFMQKYMSANDSETLVPDLIRYICCNYHPPNHVLCSDIVPRWAIIGWLLKCIKTKYVGQSAKMALFWDWFSYDTRTDNIMNIEPAILLMVHSIPKYPDMTATLLDFLATAIESFDEQRRDFARKGVHNSFSVCLSKNVVPSLAALYNCPALEPGLKKVLHPIFQPFLKGDEAKSRQAKAPGATSPNLSLSGSGSPTLLPSSPASAPSSPGVSPHKLPILPSAAAGGGGGGGGQTTATLPKLPFPQLAEVEPLMGRKGSMGLDNFDRMLMDKPLISSGSHSHHSPKRQPSPTEEMYSSSSSSSSQPADQSAAAETPEEQPDLDKGKSVARTDIPQSLLSVERTLGKLIDSLVEDGSRSFEAQSSNMHHLIAHFVKMSGSAKYSQEAATDLAQFFANVLGKEFAEFSVDTAISSKPALHHNLFSAEPSLPFALLDILHELRLLVPSLGFRFLVWLVVHGVKGIARRRRQQQSSNKRGGAGAEDESESTSSGGDQEEDREGGLVRSVDNGYQYMGDLSDDLLGPYATLVEHSASKGPAEPQEHPFLLDCKFCAEESMDTFALVVPYIFRYLPDYVNSYRAELIQLIVNNVDPTHIESLTNKLVMHEFEMFGYYGDMPALLEQSLGWESTSQYCLWQFLVAEFQHGAADGVDAIALDALDVLRSQDRAQTHELVQGILLFLRTASPSPALLQAVFALPLAFARLSCALLTQWSATDPRALFPPLIDELKKVLAKSVASSSDAATSASSSREGDGGDQDEREEMDAEGRLRVDRKYAKRVAGHLDRWCFALRASLRREPGDLGSDLVLLSGLLQRVVRAYGLAADRHQGLSALLAERNAAHSGQPDPNRKRKRASSGSASLSAATIGSSSSSGGEAAQSEQERRRPRALSKDGSPGSAGVSDAHHKRRRLSTTQGGLGVEEDEKRTVIPTSPSARQQQHGPGSQRPISMSSGGSPSLIPLGQRHASGLTSSSGGIPRRASNGALDENKPGRPEPPPSKRKRSLSGGSSAHLRPPEGAAGEEKDEGGKGGEGGAARKRKVKRISMEHEPEYDQ